MPVYSLHVHTIQVLTHRTARSFLSAAWPTLSERESAANTILPCALQRLTLERAIQTIPGDAEKETPRTDSSDGYLWFTCWSRYKGQAPHLDLILSCTDGSLGPQPIFLWSSLAPSQTTRDHIEPLIAMLIEHLSATVPIARVFSVFAPTSLTKTFSRQWSHIIGVSQIIEPIYAAKLLHATRETLTECPILPPGDCIRLGSPHDISVIGKLCKQFSETSVYYPLSSEDAIQEATGLVYNHQVWVYETDEGQIATIAAVTRMSSNVATITKVYTCATRRKGGCAERLVRTVVREMLYSRGKQRVILYVGKGNAAARVYGRVGFISLEGEERTEEVEEWLEVGFKESHWGHW